MACFITRPDPQTMFNRYKSMFSVNVLGGSEIVPESNEWYVVALNYAMAEEFYAISEQQWKERDPRFACCDNLIAMAANDGVYPRPASFASGYAKLTGTVNAPLPSRIELNVSNGINYVTVGTVPSNLGPDGSVYLRVQAMQSGPTANSPSGSGITATLFTSIPGVNSNVEICGGQFCGGTNAETCDEFRVRYIDRKKYKPRATSEWIKEKFLDWPCATRVFNRAGSCCVCDDPCENSDYSDHPNGSNCGCVNCGGRNEYYVMFDGAFYCGIAPESVLLEINQWMFGKRSGYGEGQVEIGVCGRVVEAVALPVNLYVDIEGCPTPTQQNEIKEQIEDFFTTIAPSEPLRTQQINLIVANIIGSNINASSRFELINESDEGNVFIDPCGGLEPNCDYLPCLNSIVFTGPEMSKAC